MPVPEYYAKKHAEDVAEAISEGAPAEVFPILDALTDEQRLAVFYAYCRYCGTPNARCQCWNDE